MANERIYAEFFIVKDGVRYNLKTEDMTNVCVALTNSLCDCIEKIVKGEEGSNSDAK